MNKQNKLIDLDRSMLITRGKGRMGRMKTVKGIKYMLKEGHKILGGEHTIEYTDNIL